MSNAKNKEEGLDILSSKVSSRGGSKTSLAVDNSKEIKEEKRKSADKNPFFEETEILSNVINLLAVGHPYMRYTINVKKDFLSKHKLKLEQFYNLGTDKLSILKDALDEYGQEQDINVNIGGHAVILVELIQWLLELPHSVGFLGVKPKDPRFDELLTVLRDRGVALYMQENKDARPSVWLTLQFKKKRCEILFCDSWAANLDLMFLDNPSITRILERAKCFLITDFTLCFMDKTLHRIARFCKDRFKPLCVTLSNTLILSHCKTTITEAVIHADLLFLNWKSIDTLVNMLCPLKGDMGSKCTMCPSCEDKSRKKKINALGVWMHENAMKDCVIVCTNGIKAYVNTSCKETTEKYVSTYYKPKKVVDRMDMGFAFIAGFIAMLVQGSDVAANVDCGFFTASLISKKVSRDSQEAPALNKWSSSTSEANSKKQRKIQKMPFHVIPESKAITTIAPKDAPEFQSFDINPES